MAARKAEPGAQAKGEEERDLSVEDASDLEAVGRESGGRGKGSGSLEQTRCYSGGERGRDRRCRWPGRLGSRWAEKACGCPIRESRKPLRGEMMMVTAGDTAFTVSSLEAGDAACGEPARPWTATGFLPALWCGQGARAGRGSQTGVSPKLES